MGAETSVAEITKRSLRELSSELGQGNSLVKDDGMLYFTSKSALGRFGIHVDDDMRVRIKAGAEEKDGLVLPCYEVQASSDGFASYEAEARGLDVKSALDKLAPKLTHERSTNMSF